MQISARNTFQGTVKEVTMGAVNAEIVVEIAPSIEVVSIITKGSAEALGLQVGKPVYAVVKSTDVMVAID